MGPTLGTTATVRTDGRLELRVPGRAARLLYAGTGTAMWIALCRSDWDLETASTALADTWDSDLGTVRSSMLSWVVEFAAAGAVVP